MAMNRELLEAIEKWVSNRDPNNQNDPQYLTGQTRIGARFAVLLGLEVLKRIESLEAKVDKLSKKNPT